jgi:hypothetical protein
MPRTGIRANIREGVVPSPGGQLSLGTTARALPAWRVPLAAALLSLAVGAGLYESPLGWRSSAPAAAHSNGYSHESLLSLPVAAQAPVAAALGADDPAYRVSASQGGFRAASPAQHLRSSFTASGVSVTSGATRVGLGLRGVGYGSSLTALGAVAPQAHSNRVLYKHADVTAWYSNGPLGLEQGFTIARGRPCGRPLDAVDRALRKRAGDTRPGR